MKTSLAAVALSAVLLARANAEDLRVSAGKLDRHNSVVSFRLPSTYDSKTNWQIQDGAETVPLQVLPNGQAVFILRDLKANQSKTFTIKPADAKAAAAAAAALSPFPQDAQSLTFSTAGKDVLRYVGATTLLPEGYDPAYARGGYIHPVSTPAGRIVTDDYPPNHKHHHGIWFPWTKTEFEGRHPDFWNMGAKTGRVEAVGWPSPFSGPVAQGFTAKHRFIDLTAEPDPKPALNETWRVTLYALPASDKPFFVFDLVSTQTCASDSPLILPQYYYGGLGFRGNRAWDGKENCFFVTSEGKTRENGNQTAARWVHMGGKVDGEWAGIAILGHPENFRAPQPVRLHPTEPFACFAPSQAGDWKIEPGKPYVSRYRFVVADGKPDAELIERLWKDYANPVEVSVR
jgi:Methane oxygenase PmoA